MIVGGVLAYYALQTMQQWIPSLLGLAAASKPAEPVKETVPQLAAGGH